MLMNHHISLRYTPLLQTISASPSGRALAEDHGGALVRGRPQTSLHGLGEEPIEPLLFPRQGQGRWLSVTLRSFVTVRY